MSHRLRQPRQMTSHSKGILTLPLLYRKHRKRLWNRFISRPPARSVLGDFHHPALPLMWLVASHYQSPSTHGIWSHCFAYLCIVIDLRAFRNMPDIYGALYLRLRFAIGDKVRQGRFAIFGEA